MTRSSKHSAMQEIEICCNGYVLNIEAHVAFRFTPGRPATPPSYASGGDPPEGPEIEIERVKLTRETGEVLDCDWLAEFVETSLRREGDLRDRRRRRFDIRRFWRLDESQRTIVDRDPLDGWVEVMGVGQVSPPICGVCLGSIPPCCNVVAAAPIFDATLAP